MDKWSRVVFPTMRTFRKSLNIETHSSSQFVRPHFTFEVVFVLTVIVIQTQYIKKNWDPSEH